MCCTAMCKGNLSCWLIHGGEGTDRRLERAVGTWYVLVYICTKGEYRIFPSIIAKMRKEGCAARYRTSHCSGVHNLQESSDIVIVDRMPNLRVFEEPHSSAYSLQKA